jgi:hypothetical protein
MGFYENSPGPARRGETWFLEITNRWKAEGPLIMAKGRESFEKRRLEKVREERKAEKRDKRELRKSAGDADLDEAALMEQFRLLSERHASGDIDDHAYRAQRHDIFAALGLEDPGQ